MSTVTTITAEQILAMPQDKDREIIRGELRERDMTMGNKRHSVTTGNIAYVLKHWLASRPAGSGQLLVGDAAFRLKRNPETSVGVDVAYVDRRTPDNAFIIDGPPTLAVEITSPSDTQADIHEKIALYLESGTRLVWYVEPVRKKVFVYRPDAPDEVLAEGQEVIGDPVLPGFRAKVDEFFE